MRFVLRRLVLLTHFDLSLVLRRVSNAAAIESGCVVDTCWRWCGHPKRCKNLKRNFWQEIYWWSSGEVNGGWVVLQLFLKYLYLLLCMWWFSSLFCLRKIVHDQHTAPLSRIGNGLRTGILLATGFADRYEIDLFHDCFRRRLHGYVPVLVLPSAGCARDLRPRHRSGIVFAQSIFTYIHIFQNMFPIAENSIVWCLQQLENFEKV